jgi:AcrR family transcriptional regulator
MTTAESRGAATRQALMDAASRVFEQRGFARATTREIAAAAGVAEGTIYRHFADKHALFREVFFAAVGSMGDDLRRFPERAGGGTVRGNLEYLFGLLGTLQERSAPLLASMSADPELANSFAAHIADHALEGFDLSAPMLPVAAYISAEQRLGRIRADIDAAEAAAVVVALPFATATERALSARPSTSGGSAEPQGFPSPAAAALDILAQGLTPLRTRGPASGQPAETPGGAAP